MQILNKYISNFKTIFIANEPIMLCIIKYYINLYKTILFLGKLYLFDKENCNYIHYYILLVPKDYIVTFKT